MKQITFTLRVTAPANKARLYRAGLTIVRFFMRGTVQETRSYRRVLPCTMCERRRVGRTDAAGRCDACAATHAENNRMLDRLSAE